MRTRRTKAPHGGARTQSARRKALRDELSHSQRRLGQLLLEDGAFPPDEGALQALGGPLEPFAKLLARKIRDLSDELDAAREKGPETNSRPRPRPG